MNSRISEKGQVTIPKKLRVNLGLDPGTLLEFEQQGGKIVISKKVREDAVDQWLGFAEMPSGQTVDSYLRSIRNR